MSLKDKMKKMQDLDLEAEKQKVEAELAAQQAAAGPVQVVEGSGGDSGGGLGATHTTEFQDSHHSTTGYAVHH